jgi:diguanylate cyclase (GGDEF)-like protein
MPPTSPLAIIAGGHEWLVRSLESVLSSNGYAVLRAYTPQQAREHIRTMQPDAIFIDSALGTGTGGTDLCRALRGDPALPPELPIILITSGPASRQERLEALRAGAWDLFGLPLDAEELLLQLGRYVSARLEADRVREESLLDPLTGLYNVRGMLRRVRELGAAALRHHHALGCIVFGLDGRREAGGGEAEAGEAAAPADRIAHLFRAGCRAGDTVGRLGRQELVVLAPDTDPAGALALARRLTAVTGDRGSNAEGCERIRIEAGLFAVPDFAAASIEPVEMLVRATTALRRFRSVREAERIRSFDGDGVTIVS